MSKSEEIKNAIGEDFYEAMKLGAEVCSTVNGAFAAYKVGTEVLTSLGVLGKPDNPFKQLEEKLVVIQGKLDDILEDLEEIRRGQLKIGKFISRIDIHKSASYVKSAAFNAYLLLEHPSPHNERQFTETRDEAQLSTNVFKDVKEYWLRIYLDIVDYFDIWSGPLRPPTEDGGDWVFDYHVTLPAYLGTLANWGIVILASDDGFQKGHLYEENEWLEHIGTLQEKLEKILLQGFQPIRPPNQYEMRYLIFAMDNSYFYKLGLDGVTKYYLDPQEVEGALNYIPGGKWRLSGYRCGMVEKFSGWSSWDAYPHHELAEGAKYLNIKGSFWLAGPDTPEGGASANISNHAKYQEFYDRFILRHTLRTWRQARLLAQRLGLPYLRDSICHLCDMRGCDPPELPPEWYKYVVSSMREIYSVVPNSIKGIPDTGQPISMRKLADMIGTTMPITLRRMFFEEE